MHVTEEARAALDTVERILMISSFMGVLELSRDNCKGPSIKFSMAVLSKLFFGQHLLLP